MQKNSDNYGDMTDNTDTLSNDSGDSLEFTSDTNASVGADNIKVDIVDTIEQKLTDELTLKDSLGLSLELDSSGSKIGLEQSSNLEYAMSPNRKYQYQSNDSLAFTKDGITYNHGMEQALRMGTDDRYIKAYQKNSLDYNSKDNSMGFSDEMGFKAKSKHFSSDASVKNTYALDGTRKSEYNTSATIGDKDNNIKLNSKHSNSQNIDGKTTTSNTQGMTMNAGNAEIGTSQTNTQERDKNSEKNTEVKEHSAGVSIGNGTKLKGSVKDEKSEKITDNGQSTTKEEDKKTTLNIRLEVDPESASPAAAMIAGSFNAITDIASKETTISETHKTAVDSNEESSEEVNKESVTQDAGQAEEQIIDQNNDYDYGYGY